VVLYELGDEKKSTPRPGFYNIIIIQNARVQLNITNVDNTGNYVPFLKKCSEIK